MFAWLLYGMLPCYNAFSYLAPGALTMLSQIVTEILNHHASQPKIKDYKLMPTHSRIIILSAATAICLGAVLQLQLNPDDPEISAPPSPAHISSPFDVRRNYGTSSPGHGTNHSSLSLPSPSDQSLLIQHNDNSGPGISTSSLRDSIPVDTTHPAVFIKSTPSHLTIRNPRRRLTGSRRKPSTLNPNKNRDGYRMIQVEPGVLVDDSSMSGESVYLRGHSPPATLRRAKTQDLPAAGPVDIAGQGEVGGGESALSFAKSAVAAVGGQSGSLLTSGLEAGGQGGRR